MITGGWSDAETIGIALSHAAMLLRPRAIALNTIAGVDYLWPNIFGLSNGGVGGRPENLNASLTRLSHDVVRQPDAASVRFLLGHAQEKPSAALGRSLLARRAVLSHAPPGNGAVASEFHSGEVEAFAGGGAVSQWRLEIPPASNRIDLSTLQDVQLTIRFTARHGGEQFKREVEQALPPYRAHLLIDAARDYPAQWKATAAAGGQPILLPVDRAALPRNLPGRSFRPDAVLVQATPDTGQELDATEVKFKLPQSPEQTIHLQRVNGVLRGMATIPPSSAISGASLGAWNSEPDTPVRPA